MLTMSELERLDQTITKMKKVLQGIDKEKVKEVQELQDKLIPELEKMLRYQLTLHPLKRYSTYFNSKEKSV